MMTFYKKNPSDKIWWVDKPNNKGDMEFTFDKQKIYNIFRDYPERLTSNEKRIFDAENPFWVDFFSGKRKGQKT